MTALRSLWLRLHRWFALGLGWLLILGGLTGAMLVVAQPLDRWLNPQLFQAQPTSGAASGSNRTASLEPIVAAVRNEFGFQVSIRFKLPQQDGDSLWLRVQTGDWRGTIYLNPVTGEEQARRGETEGFVNTLFKLHSDLLLGDTGKTILAWVALAYMLLLITGVILWWPKRWPGNWHIELNKSLVRALFDLHRIGGIVMGLLIAASVITGAYLAWRPLGEVLNFVSGTTPIKAPKLPALQVDADKPLPKPPSLDAMVEIARAAMPDAQISFVQVPANAKQVMRIRFRANDEPHPNGISSVWLDPRTGAVLAAQRWNEMDPGTGAAAIAYPLHTGELGGVTLEIVAALNGLALAGLGISGVWLWWRRRKARKHVNRGYEHVHR
ncbi:PepSY domain-containing protein [Diaphorobacter sp. HDW4A]|uniref:PepSY-associated TM helix domain-containing protein n=1 Tax=Diaphorobacter sp. HDW4A TaxID=2714924 RepID=UPI001408DD48|nr:PepSY-associated TM helix domain-containing protein [Diaphorobacter sp. HDW4A]QIL79949.1 PepSY domain-containing protein [Diaphorobacter sp. HDW4A]